MHIFNSLFYKIYLFFKRAVSLYILGNKEQITENAENNKKDENHNNDDNDNDKKSEDIKIVSFKIKYTKENKK